MNPFAQWQVQNNAHLGAALAWLRLRLQESEAEPDAKGGWWKGEAKETGSRALRTAFEKMEAASKVEPLPALHLLGERFGLAPFERMILLLCAAMELDPLVPALCAKALGLGGAANPTFGLALHLFDEAAWDALSPERPLRFWRLVEIHQPGAQPLTASALRIDERILNFLKGLNYLDDRLSAFLRPLEAWEGALPPSQEKAALTMVSRLRSGEAPRVIQLLGGHGPSKQLVAARVAGQLGLHLFHLGAGDLPTAAAELDQLARLWQREQLLQPLALLLEAGSGKEAAVATFVERMGGLCFLEAREAMPLRTPHLQLDVAKPLLAEQLEVWTDALGPEADGLPLLLAGQFDLGLEEIHRAAAAALQEVGDSGASLRQPLWMACLQSSRPQMDALAQRLEPKSGWEDLVLPEPEQKLLTQIARQVGHRLQVYEQGGFRARMNRGLGISALFAGESGTGKTLAAEVLAQELGLNLYRIDLSAVVNKYIGETEKNLRRLFDAAEDGGAILFFDEADALFGKRSEVKDSHDRYANIEINYLLQRMEAYRGLAILATNMKSVLDPAFLRRLRFVVNFPFPGVDERRRMWERAFPPQTPTVDLDLRHLARFNLSGGNIASIALNAAFLAAAEGAPVAMAHVLDAARTELRKLERPINEADFRLPARMPAGVA